jgi:hypothetical protein
MRLTHTKKIVSNVIERTKFTKIDTILIQPKYKTELTCANNDVN